MSPAALLTRGATRRFGDLIAVDSVDLAVGRGEIYGFLGRNGAGKTTLIRMLLGLITPTSGDVELLGTRLRGGRTPADLWQQVGYLVEGPGLYPPLTVAEHLHTAAGYRRLPAHAVDATVERLDLGRYLRVRAGTLSLGNRQRLALALALVHRPALLVLDEPANGLDPAGVVEVRELLRGVADDGVTVFMSTHSISEVALLADRIGIIHSGRMVEELPRARLELAGAERLVARLRDPALAQRAAEALRGAAISAEVHGETLVSADAAAVRWPETVASLLVGAGAPPMYLAVEREDLEQLFLRLTGDKS